MSLRNLVKGLLPHRTQRILYSTSTAQTLKVTKNDERILSPAQIAFVHRIGIQSIEPLSIRQALSHPSLTKASDQACFEELVLKGRKILEFFVNEYVACRFPNLPLTNRNIAVTMFTCPRNLATIAKGFGLEYSLVEMEGLPHIQMPSMAQYLEKMKKDGVQCSNKKPNEVLSEILLAILAQISEKNVASARKFLDSYLFSASFDASKLLRPRSPILQLTKVLRHQGKSDPVFRLLHESGRASNSSMYIVGAFAGEDSSELLAEGYGASLMIAEKRAAVEALRRCFLVQVHEPLRPSDELFTRASPNITLDKILSV